MVRKVLGAKAPSLREKSSEVKRVDKKILRLISDLKDSVKAAKDPEGVGIAAPQIGINLKIFVINYKGRLDAFINPVLVSKDKKLRELETSENRRPMEGCLSIPHFYGPVNRPKRVTIKYLDERGEEKTEEFNGFFAQIVLHELDHLEGILFIDKLLQQKKPLFKVTGDDWEEVDFS